MTTSKKQGDSRAFRISSVYADREALGHLVRNREEEEELLDKQKHQINYAVLKTK